VTNRLFTIVIDDDPSVCRALRRLLKAAQMDVQTFPSGESFLREALGRDPDCLVLDIRMPGIRGPDLRDRLNASGRHIPVVFITAHAEDENGQQSGDAKVLRKPFDGQDLIDAIRLAVQEADA
jgi:FixJ family two-component response regulator